MKPAWKKKQEDDARDFKGKETVGSGNQWAHKGDVKTEKFLIENKATDKSSYTITQKLWDKIWGEALLSPGKKSRIPLFSIRFNKTKTDLILISKDDFIYLLDEDI